MSARLPAELSVWAPWLHGLADEVQSWLLTQLATLQILVPDASPKHTAHSGEFAGYSGLATRGRYERLLMSEWLYADELPDEFLRRASSGEHVFLAPSFEAAVQSRALVVLFDCGPEQLGACRLAHLALWILLARRAQAAGWAWRWGSLQRPDNLSERADPLALQELVESRTVALADPHALKSLAALPASTQIAELWLVGPPAAALVAGMALRLHTIEIRELWRVEQRVLQIRGVGRVVELPLPEPKFAARLLRQPLEQRQTGSLKTEPLANQPFALRQPPVFSRDGHRMVLRLLDESCVLAQVPNSQRAQFPAVRKLLTTAQTVALAVGRRSIVQLRNEAGQLRFLKAFGLGEAAVVDADPDTLMLTTGVRCWSPLWHVGETIVLLDQRRRLHRFSLARNRNGIAHSAMATDVLGVQQDTHSGRLVFATAEEGGTRRWVWPQEPIDHPLLPAARRVLIQALPGAQQTPPDCFLELADQHWLRVRSSDQRAIDTAAGEQVIGCWRDALVCANAAGHFSLRDGHKGERIEVGEEMLAPAMSINGTLAWYTRNHELVLYSLSRRIEVRRFVAGPES